MAEPLSVDFGQDPLPSLLDPAPLVTYGEGVKHKVCGVTNHLMSYAAGPSIAYQAFCDFGDFVCAGILKRYLFDCSEDEQSKNELSWGGSRCYLSADNSPCFCECIPSLIP